MKAVSATFAWILAAGIAAQAVAQEKKAQEKQVLVITSLEQIPERSHRSLKKPLEELLEGYKMQVTIDRFFDSGQTGSTNRFEPYVASYVPVNSKGNKDGVEHFLNSSNRLERTATWKDGVKHGIEQVYNERPRYVAAEVPWKNGVLEGVRKTFYPDGSLRSETPYVDGQPHGEAKSYSKDGKLTRKCTMKNGKRDGKLVDWWPETGKQRRVIQYDMGDVKGVVKEFYPDGELKREVPFVDNLMHGEEKRYEADGEPARSRYWIGGNLVSKTEFELKFKGR